MSVDPFVVTRIPAGEQANLGGIHIGQRGRTDEHVVEDLAFDGRSNAGVTKKLPGRCSTDHHNLLIQPSPVAFLHHTSWQADDVDEVGRGALRVLEGHPERHIWGLGRHFIGSNFFWYLRDPAGHFSEYYSDIDSITDDQLWTLETWEPSLRALYAWGPDVPPSMLAPDDLADLMQASHQS